MTWDTKDIEQRREQFVELAGSRAVSVSELCRRFGISRKTGHKWLRRFEREGREGLADRKPARSRRSNQTAKAVEEALLALRAEHPTWGPRKLCRRLQDLGGKAPASSSAARLLRRSGCISPKASLEHQPWQRFERAEPNELWQMDFKGHFALHKGRCHPLTVLDDHSRYLVGLFACPDEQGSTVGHHLRQLFELHGLPGCILCDNGPPWASGPGHSELTVWLLRLGVQVIHGRPFHPQTQGKDERFHRTLKADLLNRHDWPDLSKAQRRFDAFRRLYNHDRPHEALDLAVPASRYHPSPRPMPKTLPNPEYAPGEITRTVKSKGEITFLNRFFYVGRAFNGLSLALRPTASSGLYRLCYSSFTLGAIDCSLPPLLPKGLYHPLLPYPPKLLPS